MAKMDISTWKEFRVGDLFEITGSKTTPKKELNLCDEEEFPYVTTAATTNGVCGYSSVYTEKGNVLTVDSAVLGTVFYQAKSFTASDHVEKLIPKFELNEDIGLFLACVLNSFGRYFGYAYTDKRSQMALKQEVIMLPATEDGNPDWEYMENYILACRSAVSDKLTGLLSAKDAEKHQVDTAAWGAFRVGDLFDVMTSRSIDKIHLEFDVDAPYDFIGRTSINNGVQGKLGKIEFDPNPRGTFSVTQIGERLCQYRENEWYASQNIFVLSPRVDMMRVAYFMTTVLTEMLKRIYGDDAYASYPTLKSLPNDIIKLPITSSGEPDWDYMEQYMSRIMQRQNAVVDALKKI